MSELEIRLPTSIKIRPSVWKQAKVEAIQNDIHLSELVEQAIESWIKQQGSDK